MQITPMPENPEYLHGEGPDAPLWGIVDCARDPTLHPDVEQLDQDRVCLFAGPLDPDIKASSPHLVRLREGDAFLQRWRTEGLGQHWGVFFRSNEEMEHLRRHFRKKLLVKLPDGRKVLFRFYDPRVAAGLPSDFLALAG